MNADELRMRNRAEKAIPHYGDGRATRERIRDATANALAAAEDLGCESIVISVLGTGVAGFSFEEGARIVCEAVRDPSASG